MKKDGLVPIAFGDKDGWPAMGTFDYLNMRANGYDFHISLMAGKESWTDPKVKQVFDLWRGLLPYHQQGANGRTWQEAAQTLAQKKSGMASRLPHLVPAVHRRRPRTTSTSSPSRRSTRPYGQDAVEAPIDGFMLAKKPRTRDGGARSC